MNDTEIREKLTRIVAEHRLPLDVPADPERAREIAGAALSWLLGVGRRVAALVVPDAERVLELHLPNGDPAGVYYCAACSAVYPDPQHATCCGPRYCACGAELPKNRIGCDACFDHEQAEKAKSRWEAATPKTPAEYGDGMIYVKDAAGRCWPSNRDGWHDSIEALCEFIDDWRQDHPGEPDPVLYVFGSKPRRMKLDSGIVEHELEEFHEDALDEIPRAALAELDKYLATWCEKHSPTTYDQDLGTKIVGWEPER